MSDDTIVTINSRKYDGTIRRSWKCRLLERRRTRLILVGEFDREVEHADLGVIRRGTISYEYYWTDRWYNIFRFHHPDGELRNHYCNVNMPPQFSGNTLDYVDLDIDVLVKPDMTWKVLDEDEFEENAKKFSYPEHLMISVRKSLEDLKSLIEAGKLP